MLQQSIVSILLLTKLLLIWFILWYSYYVLPYTLPNLIWRVVDNDKLSFMEIVHFIFGSFIFFSTAWSWFLIFKFFLGKQQLVFLFWLIRSFLSFFVAWYSLNILPPFLKHVVIKFQYNQTWSLQEVCHLCFAFFIIYVTSWCWLLILNRFF